MAQEAITKLQERKNAIAEEIVEKRGVFDSSDVETRETLLEEVGELEGEAEKIDEEVKGLQETQAKLAEQESRMSLIKNVETVEVEARTAALETDKYDTPEYRKAWVEAIRTGKGEELRAWGTDMENAPIPTLMQGYVETAWEKYGKFSQIVNKSYVKGYFAIPLEVEADSAVWHDENGAAVTPENLTLGQVLLAPKMIKKVIEITDEMMAMVPEEFMRYVADELVYRVVLVLDNAIISGTLDTNGKGVAGIVNNANTLSVDSALTFNAINAVVAQLVTFDNLTIAMNPQTFFNNYMGLTDLQGRPIYQIATDNTGKPQYMINGIRVEFTQALKSYDAASAGDVWAVVGDFRGYRLNLPEGDNVITLFDPYTKADSDVARMIGRIYAAGNVARLKHFGQLKKAS